VQQHANERRVRTLEEDDEAASSVTEVNTSSANDDIEYDLEELDSIDNNGKDVEEDENDTSGSVDDADSDDNDDVDVDDDDMQLKSEDILSSDVPRTDGGNIENSDNSSWQGIDTDISEAFISFPVLENIAEVSADTSGAVARIGQSAVPTDKEAVDDVNVETCEISTGSHSKNALDEFPDTSIELHHVSGSTYVDL